MITFCYIGFFPDYEKYFFQYVEDDEINAVSFNPMDSTSNISYFNKLPRFIRNSYHKFLIKKYILSHPNYIYIFNEHRLILEAIVKYLESDSSFKGCLLIRNPISNHKKTSALLEKLKSFNIQQWSFDVGDCEKYNLYYYNQFISQLPEITNVTIKYDLSFIGRNKGRDVILRGLENKVEREDLKFFIDLKDGTKANNISYINYLEESLSARCIVEILQNGQSGMTLRPIEALFYNRKLVTNNQCIVNEPFYHPNNILVVKDISDISALNIKSFIEKPLVEIDQTVKEKYTTASLLNTLYKQIEGI